MTELTISGPTVTVRLNDAGKPVETLVRSVDRIWSSTEQTGQPLPDWVMDALADRFVQIAGAL